MDVKIHSNEVLTKSRDWVKKKPQMGCKNTLIWALSKNTDWEGAKTPQIGCMNILRWVTKITEMGCRQQSDGIGCQKAPME